MIFASLREGAAQLFAKSADGTRVVERLTHSETELVRHSISPDGQLLVVEERSSDTGTNLALLSREGDSETRPLLRTQFTERNAEISPDGRWTAYESNASGRFEMYVQPFPNLDDGKWMVLVDGGTRPLWAPDGRELFFLDDSHLMVVAMENDFSVGSGTPEILFDEPFLQTPARNY